MSHCVTVKTTIQDLDTLRAAFEACGLTVVQSQTFRVHEGDLPCNFRAELPGVNNRHVGIIQRADGTYEMQFDSWNSASIAKAIGWNNGAPTKVLEEYAVVRATTKAVAAGFNVSRRQLPDGRIVLDITETARSRQYQARQQREKAKVRR